MRLFLVPFCGRIAAVPNTPQRYTFFNSRTFFDNFFQPKRNEMLTCLVIRVLHLARAWCCYGWNLRQSHNLPTTHTTPATKNGSRKKMTACRDVPWCVSYRALPTRLSKSCTRDLVQKNFGGTSNTQFVNPRRNPASASPPARTYTCVPMPMSL